VEAAFLANNVTFFKKSHTVHVEGGTAQSVL
jgi:hypothetical protein